MIFLIEEPTVLRTTLNHRRMRNPSQTQDTNHNGGVEKIEEHLAPVSGSSRQPADPYESTRWHSKNLPQETLQFSTIKSSGPEISTQNRTGPFKKDHADSAFTIFLIVASEGGNRLGRRTSRIGGW